MPTLQYRLSTKQYDGKAEVLVRFYSGKVFSQRGKTRIIVPVCAWNEQSASLTIPKKISPQTQNLLDLQRQLDSLKSELFSAWWKDQFDAGEGWLQQTIDSFFSIPQKTNRKTLSSLVRECATVKQIHERTAEQYEVLANAIDRYGEKHRVLYCDNFTPDQVEKFVEFFREEIVTTRGGKKKLVQRGNNTIVSKLKRLSSACSWGVRKGFMAESPFGSVDENKYVIPSEVYGTAICLTRSERDILYSFDFPIANHRLYRDIFVFQCHVGCRVSDLFSLTQDNITPDGFLQYIQQKTISKEPQTVRVPLDDAAKSILSRYDCEDGRLFPFQTPERYNEIIHTICHIAGLTRKVLVLNPVTGKQEVKELWEVTTSHTARKTFMQLIFRNTKDSVVTASFTGHSLTTKVFKNYATVDDEMKIEVLQDIEKN